MMKHYPRSAKYDYNWIRENWMGPHPLWLMEELCEHIELEQGMKVLDMGCGKAITSVFLAKEFGVTVFATDLWIGATDNLQRIREAGVDDLVFPIHAEAHALPFAHGFFDVVIAIDSYHYFGTDDAYLPDVFAELVEPGGQLGIVVPGLVREYEKGYPDTLEAHWNADMFTFHSKDWWRRLWQKTGLVEVTACYDMEHPKEIWQTWAEWSREHLNFDDDEFLAADTGNDVALIVMAATKKQGAE